MNNKARTLTNGTDTVTVYPYNYDADYLIDREHGRYFEKVQKTKWQELSDYSGTFWSEVK